MTKSLGVALLLLSLAGGAHAATGKVPACDPKGPNFCTLDGAEDIAFIPGSDWMLTGAQMINVKTKQRVPFPAPPFEAPKKVVAAAHGYADTSAPDCPGPPTYLHVGANDIKRVGSEVHIVIINHPDPKSVPPDQIGGRVELFSVDPPGGSPVLHWLGCFPVPLPYNLNDVAIGPKGDIYASHQHERVHSPRGAGRAASEVAGA